MPVPGAGHTNKGTGRPGGRDQATASTAWSDRQVVLEVRRPLPPPRSGPPSPGERREDTIIARRHNGRQRDSNPRPQPQWSTTTRRYVEDPSPGPVTYWIRRRTKRDNPRGASSMLLPGGT